MTLCGIEKLQTRKSDSAPVHADKNPRTWWRRYHFETLASKRCCHHMWQVVNMQQPARWSAYFHLKHLKRQTFAIEDTQHPLIVRNLTRQNAGNKETRFRSSWSHLRWIYCTVSNIPLMTTKCLFRLAWNHAFLRLYLLRHKRVNAFARS